MLSFVLVTSILNILLGVGLALLVTARPRAAVEAAAAPVAPAASPPVPVPVAPPVKVEAPQPIKFVMEDLSPDWIEKLSSESVVAKSMAEASSQVLRLEVGRYRENLVAWEDKISSYSDADFAEKIREAIANIVKLNEEWLKIQSEAVGALSSQSAKLDTFREISERLEEVLLGQTSQIESTANNLLQLRTTDSPAALRVSVVRELHRLIDLSHLLRDAIQRALLSIIIAEQRVERVEKKLATDAQTQLLSPIGLEAVFEQWKQADPSRQKPTAIGLLGLDQFRNINETEGTRWADALLTAVAQLCAETIRKDRGFDRIARINGDTFAVFYGDTSIRTCVAAMERVRQTLQQSTFSLNGRSISLKGTCAAAAQVRSESLSQTLDRAVAALRVAKAKAREAIVIDEGNGAEIIEAPQMTVRPVRVEIPTTLEKNAD